MGTTFLTYSALSPIVSGKGSILLESYAPADCTTQPFAEGVDGENILFCI